MTNTSDLKRTFDWEVFSDEGDKEAIELEKKRPRHMTYVDVDGILHSHKWDKRAMSDHRATCRLSKCIICSLHHMERSQSFYKAYWRMKEVKV